MVRFRNSGSRPTLGTTMGSPVATTRPVTPSPIWYRPRWASSGVRPKETSTRTSSAYGDTTDTVPRFIPSRRARMPRIL